ncbi:wlm [Ascosphaera apis ARSEF 7405]|uniref:Wlm n=1 Tax=Ascosphaera apis ARSEF 7405 TaxID=392613 RepID=A0A167WMC8_9EURO|nr:wlm [Ascosphaera apis ARSEF 7405]
MGEADSPETTTIRTLQIHFHGQAHTIDLPSDATLQDLSKASYDAFNVPPENQKFLISPKPGIRKFPFEPTPLSELFQTESRRFKVTLLGSTAAEVSAIDDAAEQARKRERRDYSRYAVKPETPRPRRTQASRWTFHTLRPLSYLPFPERSLQYLERLRDDPGIRRAMEKHKFSVGLLTEMDPVEHTTHDSKTLGLNRNKGEVIELRLRTDGYDGYRNYKVVRDTLCHELAHCVHSEHDRNFWDLTKQIEQEVRRNDYRDQGQALTEMEFYNPEKDPGEETVHLDHGGWTGGQYVLGGRATPEGQHADAPLSRREILAQAAERRLGRSKLSEEEKTDEQHPEDNATS